jgi:hypothetical protein
LPWFHSGSAVHGRSVRLMERARRLPPARIVIAVKAIT